MAPTPTLPALAPLSTCSYKEFPDKHPAGPIPVQFANSTPRTLRYNAKRFAVPSGYPLRSTFHLPKPEFTERYRRRVLDNRAQIEEEIAAVRKAAKVGPEHPLVLLCFENPLGKLKEGQPLWCHRTIFAALWTELTGQPIQELGQIVMAETAATERELGLF